jgi:hypothetical protein
MQFKCFDDSINIKSIDVESFQFGHKLLDHPALQLENLAQVIPALPKDRVMYSKGLLKMEDDFETTFRSKPKGHSIEQTIETIRTSNSYIMIRGPECAASFAELFRDLLHDVDALIQARKVGRQAIDPQLYLFIASPNSVTPFHIDRYSTFLLQFRGSKKVVVFPQWDERIVSPANLENYVARANTKLPWDAKNDEIGVAYDFHPGEAIHIPFAAGHHVVNGPSDVSISLSIIFNTDQSVLWLRALKANRIVRSVASPLGMNVKAVGKGQGSDGMKSKLWQAMELGRKVMGRDDH